MLNFNSILFTIHLNKKKINLKNFQLYSFYLNIFFYKNNFYKNNFYKNIYTYHNILNLNLMPKNNLNFNFFLLNFFLFNGVLKLNNSQFTNQYDEFINLNFIDSETNLVSIPDENVDEFNDVFYKKNKFFFYKNFFKNKEKLNKNSLVSIFSFLSFNLTNPNSYTNFQKNTKINFQKNTLYFYSPFFFKFFSIFIFLQKNFFVKKNYLYVKSNLKFNLIFSKKKQHSFKKNNFFEKNKNTYFHTKILNNNFFLNKFISPNVIYFNQTLLNDVNDNINLDFSKNDFFFKNFFFRNFFYFNKNFNINFSNNFLNSFFYNIFFDISSDQIGVKNVTNYTPHNILHSRLVNKIFSKLNVNYVPSFYRYIYYSVANSIEFLLKKKFFLKIFSKSIKDNTVLDHIDTLFLKNRSMQSRIGRGFFLHEMLDILYMTFFHKDLNFLIKWFVKTMNRISFLNHKKFISSFKQIVLNNSDFFIKNNNIRGFYFDIRGKVGVTGDAKKRHFSFYVGDFSKTSKKYKFDYQFDIVRTYTGALGITMYLSYK